VLCDATQALKKTAEMGKGAGNSMRFTGNAAVLTDAYKENHLMEGEMHTCPE
jgi:hypothetical protein